MTTKLLKTVGNSNLTLKTYCVDENTSVKINKSLKCKIHVLVKTKSKLLI